MTTTRPLARTIAGLSHRNTLVIPNLRTVVVFVDTPHLSSGLQDRFRLSGQESEYDRTLRRSDAVPQDEFRMALHFTEVPAVGTYSLYHVLTAEIENPVFLEIPFADLPSYGEDTVTASIEEPKGKKVFEGPPRPELDDPLLHLEAADFKLDTKRYLDLLAYRTRKSEDGSAP